MPVNESAHDVTSLLVPGTDVYKRQIRRNPKSHPLRTTLLKVEILPYQLDGIAFAASAGRAILADDMGCLLYTSRCV